MSKEKDSNDSRLDIVNVHTSGGYSSDFEYDDERERRQAKRKDLATTEAKSSRCQVNRSKPREEFTREHVRTLGQAYKLRYAGLDAYTLHKKLVNDYLLYYPGATDELRKKSVSQGRRDIDVIREEHRFLWTEEDDADSNWEKKLAKKYYDKLFKEYCICDLSGYKHNKVAMRWRTESEVVEGKGQFVCGSRICNEKDNLKSWEVNFGYTELGEKKNALVKIRLCLHCSYKLNYRYKKREVVKKKRKVETKYRSSSDESRNKYLKKGQQNQTQEREFERNEASQCRDDTEKVHEQETSVWAAPAPSAAEKSREEEYDEYLEALFL